MMQTAPAEPDPATAARHRAMPYTRLVDCGMNPADAVRLLDETSRGYAWTDAAGTIGEERAADAMQAQLAGHRQTAFQSARWAVGANLFAQMAENLDTDLKAHLYDRYTASVIRLAQLRDPAIERVEVPFRGAMLVGWLCLPSGGTAAATAVVWGGLSGWGAAYLPLAEALCERGIACLLAEGPGQGEPRIKGRLYVDGDVADGFARFLDVVEQDSRLGDATGVCGNSFGGLFAARLAAQDHRVAACVVNGAPATPVLPPFRMAREQFSAALGTDDAASLDAILEQLRFDAARQPIDCPVLVLHGGLDALVPESSMQEPFARAAGRAGELREWPDGQHTLYNRAAERDLFVADWFSDHLSNAEPASVWPRQHHA